MVNLKKYFSAFLFLSVCFPIFLFAQTPIDQGGAGSGGSPSGITVSLQNPLRMGSLEELLIAILNLIMVLMVPVMVFFIIYAGFKYVTARGNVSTIEEATRALTYAVIGGVIILGAVAISQMIKNTVDEFRVDTTASTYNEMPQLT